MGVVGKGDEIGRHVLKVGVVVRVADTMGVVFVK